MPIRPHQDKQYGRSKSTAQWYDRNHDNVELSRADVVDVDIWPIRLGRGGCDNAGHYWGNGKPLWMLIMHDAWGNELTDYIRAERRELPMQLRTLYPHATLPHSLSRDLPQHGGQPGQWEDADLGAILTGLTHMRRSVHAALVEDDRMQARLRNGQGPLGLKTPEEIADDLAKAAPAPFDPDPDPIPGCVAVEIGTLTVMDGEAKRAKRVWAWWCHGRLYHSDHIAREMGKGKAHLPQVTTGMTEAVRAAKAKFTSSRI